MCFKHCFKHSLSSNYIRESKSEPTPSKPRGILMVRTGDSGAQPCWKCWSPSEARPGGNGGSATATGPRLSAGMRAPDQRPTTGVIGRYFFCCPRAGYDDAQRSAPECEQRSCKVPPQPPFMVHILTRGDTTPLMVRSLEAASRTMRPRSRRHHELTAP
jgi:hypothetical protein